MLVASLNNQRNASGVLRQWVTVRLHLKLSQGSIWTGVFGLSTVCVGLCSWLSVLPARKETVNSSIMRTLPNTKLMWSESSVEINRNIFMMYLINTPTNAHVYII